MAVLGSTIIPTTVNKLDLNYLQLVLIPSFVVFDMFALVVPYLFSVLLVLKNYDWLGRQIYEIIPFVPITMYKRNDIS